MPFSSIGAGTGGAIDALTTRREDGAYSASNEEHIVSDGGTITLPSPTSDGIVLVSQYDTTRPSVESPSGSIEGRSSVLPTVDYPLVFVSDGSNWYVSDARNSSLSIPDSGDLYARFDATALALSDGNSVSTWGDETGNGHDLTAGTAPTYRTGIINGNPVVRFDGADDFLDVAFPDLSQPNTVYMVAQSAESSPSAFDEIHDSADDTNNRHTLAIDDGNWAIYAGTVVRSSTPYDNSSHIFGELFNTTSSALRLDGSQIASGDVGSQALSGLTVGSNSSQGTFAAIDVGEIVIYPQDKSGIQSDIESYLSDKWGITV
jgi:hypothetical protein